MKLKSYYNLPNKVIFCKKCVLSNQKPNSIPEFKHTRYRKNANYIVIDKDGTCDGCKQAEVKESINWEEREKKLGDAKVI